MPRLSKTILLSILAFTFITLLSCDKYNIVEPRLYDDEDVDNQYLHYFDGSIRFAIPEAAHVVLYITGSAGNIIKILDFGALGAGYHSYPWDWRDDNGEKYPDGVYCLYLIAGDFNYRRCVDYDDPEDYLP